MPEGAVIDRRASGILLHPTSLPGPGTGDLGEHAFAFVDWLRAAEQSLWQVLPLVAVNEGGSPYNALSAFAGNTLLISPGELVLHGLLAQEDAEPPPLPAAGIDFAAVTRWKDRVLQAAWRRLRDRADPELRDDVAGFAEANRRWLLDYALFRALRDAHGWRPWTEWPAGLRRREPSALREAGRKLRTEVERHIYAQYLFDLQWSAVREHAHRQGIRIIGDLPIFVAHDSADVWANQHLFELNEEGHPTAVSGVPPDYFSASGQRWGNPLYRWDELAEDGFRWWVERFRRTLAMVDVVRVDHFRGFESFWEIPAHEPTAVRGRWREGPGRALFDAVRRQLGSLPLVAEDLGIITPEVEVLRDALGLPGMRVLQFADADPRSPHLPANYVVNSVAYTGTHDNDTAAGWYAAGPGRKRGRGAPSAAEAAWGMIEAVLHSPAGWAVVPLQDVLGLGSEARMNTPGVAEGNWAWRLQGGELTPALAARLAAVVQASGRAPLTRRAVDGRV